MLFVAAKVSHLNLLPQGKAEKGSPRPQYGPADGFRKVWQLHRNRLVRGGMPQRNQPDFYREDESRLRVAMVKGK